MPLARKQSAHVMTTVPATNTTLLNAPPGTAGGKENIGTATSSTFTMTTPPQIKCIDTYSVPPGSYPSLSLIHI